MVLVQELALGRVLSDVRQNLRQNALRLVQGSCRGVVDLLLAVAVLDILLSG